jgi:transposase
MEISEEQRQALKDFSRRGEPSYLRIKALVLWNLFRGYPVSELAVEFEVSRQSIYHWKARFLSRGLEGFRIVPGRGRKAQVDLKELECYLRQSPRHFGVKQTRWSLKALAQTVPSLHGFSAFGVQKALRRAGFRYKCGQPHLHSPDPRYLEKKGLWTKP